MSCCGCCREECPRLKFIGSVFFTFVTFALSCIGAVQELLGDHRLLFKINEMGVDHVHDETKWLRITYYTNMTVYILFAITILYLCINDVMLARLRHFEGEDVFVAQNKIASVVRYLQLVTALGGYAKILLYGSLLNKFRAQGLWDGTDDFTWQNFFVVIPIFGTWHEDSWSVALQLKAAINVTGFNILRSMTLFLPMSVIMHKSAWKKIVYQVLFILPSVIIAGAIGFKGVTSLLVFHYTQRYYTSQGDFNVNSTINIAIVAAVFGFTVVGNLLFFITIILTFMVTPDEYAEAVRLSLIQAPFRAGLLPLEQVVDNRPEFKQNGYGHGILIFALIAFSCTMAVHSQTPVWNWYFLVDVIYNGILWGVMFLFCCCACLCMCGKNSEGYQEIQAAA